MAEISDNLLAGLTSQLQTAASGLTASVAATLPESADLVARLSAAIDEQVQRLGQSLRAELAQVQDQQQRQTQEQLALQQRKLRSEALWQWVTAGAAVVAAVAGWLFKS